LEISEKGKSDLEIIKSFIRTYFYNLGDLNVFNNSWIKAVNLDNWNSSRPLEGNVLNQFPLKYPFYLIMPSA
jgi:hypothetical protein